MKFPMATHILPCVSTYMLNLLLFGKISECVPKASTAFDFSSSEVRIEYILLPSAVTLANAYGAPTIMFAPYDIKDDKTAESFADELRRALFLGLCVPLSPKFIVEATAAFYSAMLEVMRSYDYFFAAFATANAGGRAVFGDGETGNSEAIEPMVQITIVVERHIGARPFLPCPYMVLLSHRFVNNRQ